MELAATALSARNKYFEDGYITLRSCVERGIVEQMGLCFEESLSKFAFDNDVSREDYLSVLNKWSHCNSLVMNIMEALGAQLRHKVADTLGADVAWPVGAVMFRKSSAATESGNIPTHPHQDISYVRFRGSQQFRATTWVPLLLRNADTLCFARGSHKEGINAMVDFLEDSKPPLTPECTDIVDLTLGDVVLFDSRTWHASTALPSTVSLRLAIGIQWLTPGGLDGLSNGEYFRYPDSDLPSFVDLRQLKQKNIFCMDTSGYFLKKALVALDMKSRSKVTDFDIEEEMKTASTFKLAEKFCDDNEKVKEILQSNHLNIMVQTALRKYVLFRKAAHRHFGESQGPQIFRPLYESLIKPILFD